MGWVESHTQDIPIVNQVVPAVLDNPISDAATNAIDSAGNTINNAADQVGSFVDNSVPGGWATVGAVAATVATAGAVGAFDATAVGADTATTAADSGALVTPVPDTPITITPDPLPPVDVPPVDVPPVDVPPPVETPPPVDVPPPNVTITPIPDTPITVTPDPITVPPPFTPEIAAQTGLDNLVAQQSALYPAIGNNIIGLPQLGEAALSGAAKGVLGNVLIDAITGRPITPKGVLTSAALGGLGGAAGNFAGQLGAGAFGSSLIGGATSLGAGALLGANPLSSGATGVLGATTLSNPLSAFSVGALGGSSTNSSLGKGSSTSAQSVTPPSQIQGSGLAGAPVLTQKNKILAQLKQMYPQLEQVNPKLLNQLGLTEPDTEASDASQYSSSPLIETSLADTFKIPTFKTGGQAHNPEFITGHTGHYAQGMGDGQSDDIKALLNDGDYVMDAEAVAQLGNGSSKAGKDVLEHFRRSLPQTHHASGGKVPAMIADGEYVLPSSFVASLGKGNSDVGAKMLDKMRQALREHKRSAPLNKIPPPSKSPLEYLREGLKMKEKR